MTQVDAMWQAARDPVAPAPGLQYGGFWIRTLAYLVDSVLLAAILFVISTTTGIEFFRVQGQQISSGTFAGGSLFVSPTLAGLLAYLAYFGGLWSMRGQTIGMMLFGLRILRASDGAPIGPGRAVGRFFGMILAFAVLLIGVIWVAADGRKQGWHDKLARTVVVRPARNAPPSGLEGGP